MSYYPGEILPYVNEVLSAEDRSTFRAELEVVPVEAEYPAITVVSGNAFTPKTRINPDGDDGVETEYPMHIEPWNTGMSHKFATAGNMSLDGTYRFPFTADDAIETNGEYWGKWFYPTANVVIRATADEAVELGGGTIVFDDKVGEYASHVKMEALNASGSVITSAEVTDNDSPLCVISLAGPTSGIRSLRWTVYADSWVGEYFIKVSAVKMGMEYVFTDDDVISFEIVEEQSFLGTSLAIPQATLTVDNSDGFFSVVSPNSVTRYFRKAMPIRCAIIVAGYEADCFWPVYDWNEDRENETATFVMKPSVGFESRFTNVSTGSDWMYNIYYELRDDNDRVAFFDTAPEAALEVTGNRYWGEAQHLDSSMQVWANSMGMVWDINRLDVYKCLDPWNDLTNVRSIGRDDIFTDWQVSQATDINNIIVQYQTLESGSMVGHDYSRAISSDVGDNFYVYAQCLRDLADVRRLSVTAENWLANRLKIAATIKGDPMLRPLDMVTVEIGTGDNPWHDALVTKTTTTYGDGIMTTQVEALISENL